MKLSKLKSLFALIGLVVTSSSALANYTCTGLVRGVAMDLRSGDVITESIGAINWPRLCSVHTATNGIPADVCKHLYATLLTAQTTGKTVTFWVSDPGEVCPALPAWEWVQGLYFLRINE